ncbi:MAG TPA: sensor histidine kinase [Rhodocyclaceae bacterium]|nr:sensor histidine kinase [Rhodocyclaceae bacterium]
MPAADPLIAATPSPTRPRRVMSLRARLLLFLLGPLVGMLALSIYPDYRSNLSQASEAYDHALASTAVALAALIGVHHGELRVDLSPSAEAVLRTDPYDKVFFAVFNPDGRRIAGDQELQGKTDTSQDETPAFHDDVLKGQDVRVVTYRAKGSGGEALIVVAETMHKRERAAARAVAITLVSNLLLVAATLMTVFFGIQVALRPLVGLGATIARRAPGDLRPVDDAVAPREVRPLVDAINHLMGNLRKAHEAQQAFISNAAHQLRTPIAGLQTQLELAAENLPEEARPRMERLRDTFRRLSHLTHQMLALARSAPEADLGHEFQRLDLADLCEGAASDFIDAALAKQIDLGFETYAAKIDGSPWLLRELLANLLDNAITYTPAGGHVTARCGTESDGTRYLEVEDDGPGIADDQRDRIFERFYRAGASAVPGTGLGLAIVKEAADRHRAAIHITTPENGRGVMFRVEFPKSHAA